MDRINHVKILTPDPAAVASFLTDVLDVPEGWDIGEVEPAASVASERPSPSDALPGRPPDLGGPNGPAGMIVGDTTSRQFQVFQGAEPRIWAVAVGTRHLERAHRRCAERDITCTEIRETPWHGSSLEYFFAEVGGIVFEVLRVLDG